MHPEVSPDGASVAYAAAATGSGDLGVWSQSFTSGARTLLGTGYRPDSGRRTDRRWRSIPGSTPTSSSGESDGPGQGEPVVATPADENVGDWSSDGKYLFFDRRDSATGWDLWYLERDETGNRWASEPRVFLKEPALSSCPSFRRTGVMSRSCHRRVAAMKLYVRPFPGGSRQWTVSTTAGRDIAGAEG